MTPAATLRSFLADGESRLVVSAYDGLTARVADVAGFEVLHLSGFAASAALAAVPDIGLLSMTEMVDACRRICEASGRPVIADADTGYGNPLNVRRTIREFEAAGAAGVHIEDQVAPKRCGHMEGKQVIPSDEMVAKIRAAVDSRRSDDFVVIARTDARAVEGLDAAIERAHVYREAGADVLFVEAPRSREEIDRIARELGGPQLFNWAYDGQTPHVSREYLRELGYSLVLFADVASVVLAGLASFHGRLARAESLDELHDTLTSFNDMTNFLQLPEWRELERRYTT